MVECATLDVNENVNILVEQNKTLEYIECGACSNDRGVTWVLANCLRHSTKFAYQFAV